MYIIDVSKNIGLLLLVQELLQFEICLLENCNVLLNFKLCLYHDRYKTVILRTLSGLNYLFINVLNYILCLLLTKLSSFKDRLPFFDLLQCFLLFKIKNSKEA